MSLSEKKGVLGNRRRILMTKQRGGKKHGELNRERERVILKENTQGVKTETSSSPLRRTGDLFKPERSRQGAKTKSAATIKRKREPLQDTTRVRETKRKRE